MMSGQSIYTLGLDVSELVGSSKEAVEALRNINLESVRLAKVTEKTFEDSFGLPVIERKIKLLTDKFEQIELILQNASGSIGGHFRLVDKTVSQDLEKLNKTTQKGLDGQIAIQKQFERAAERMALSRSLENQLGGIGRGFSPQGIINIRSTQNTLAGLVSDTLSGERINTMLRAIRLGIFETSKEFAILTDEERKAEVQLRRLIKAFNDAGTAGKRTQDILISWQGLVRIFVVQQIHSAIGRLSESLISAGQHAYEFSQRVGEVQTLTQDANRSTKDWEQSLSRLSSEFNSNLLKTTEAAYETLSNQIARGANVSYFLADALTFARVTSSSAEQSVNLLSAAINAFGTSTIATDRLTAQFFKTIDLGRVRAQDMQKTFGNVAIGAGLLQIKTEELLGSISTLTRQGVRYDTSATLINNIINKMLKPTEALTALWQKYGVASGEAAVRTFGFAGVLRILNSEFQKGGLTGLGELGNDMRAIRGMAGLAGDAFKDLESDITKIKNSQQQYTDAAETTADTLANKLGKELTKVNNLFLVDGGQRFNQILFEIVSTAGGAAENIKPYADGLLNLFSAGAKVAQGLILLNKFSNDYLLSNSQLLPMLVTSGVAYYTISKAVTFFTARQALLRQETEKLMLPVDQTVKFVDKLKVVLLGVQLQAGGTTASLLTLEGAVAGLTFGIPLLIAGITYLISTYDEAHRKVDSIVSETKAKMEENNRDIVKNLERRLDEENQLLIEELDKQEQTMLQSLARINAGINASKLTFDKTAFKFAQQDFEDSLFGKNSVEQADLMNARLNEMNDQLQKLNWAEQGEAATRVLEEMGRTTHDLNKMIQKDTADLDKQITKLQDKLVDNELENKLFGKSKAGQSSILKDEISKLLGTGELEKAADLADKLVKLAETRGQRVSASAIQDDISNKLIEKLNGQKEDLLGRKIDEKSLIKEQTEKLEFITQQYKNQKEAQQELLNIRKAINQELERTAKLESEALQNTQSSRANFIGNADRMLAAAGSLSHFLNNDKTRLAGDTLQTLIKDIVENIKKNNNNYSSKESGKALIDIIQQFQRTNGDFMMNKVGNEGDTVQDIISDLVKSYQEFNDVFEKQKEAVQARADAQQKDAEFLEEYSRITKNITEYSKKFADVVPKLQSPLLTLESIVERTAENGRKLFDATTAIDRGVNGKALGGLIGFGSGGLIGGGFGRDNQYIKAHRGEFIVNSEAASMFYPQLVAMNSGYNNAGSYNNGGPITQVGDININANVTGNTSMDVVKLGQALRREIQRGTVRL